MDGSLSDLLVGAFALMLVCEGVLPFVNPGLWRRIFARVALMTDGQVRFLGLGSMLAGILMLAFFLH